MGGETNRDDFKIAGCPGDVETGERWYEESVVAKVVISWIWSKHCSRSTRQGYDFTSKGYDR